MYALSMPDRSRLSQIKEEWSAGVDLDKLPLSITSFIQELLYKGVSDAMLSRLLKVSKEQLCSIRKIEVSTTRCKISSRTTDAVSLKSFVLYSNLCTFEGSKAVVSRALGVPYNLVKFGCSLIKDWRRVELLQLATTGSFSVDLDAVQDLLNLPQHLRDLDYSKTSIHFVLDLLLRMGYSKSELAINTDLGCKCVASSIKHFRVAMSALNN